MNTTPDDINPDACQSVELLLCPGCLAENTPRADFCHKCGMPISSTATLDPLKHIYAQGWMYRRACTGRTSKIILIGMWLLFGPGCLVVGCQVYDLFSHGFIHEISDLVSLLGGFLVVGFTVIYAAILYRVTKRYFWIRNLKPGHCEVCGYNLFGLPEPCCPECGTRFHPEDVYNDQKEQENKH